MSMERDKRTYINLLIKSAHTIFCFYHISDHTMRDIEKDYGYSFFASSIPTIKIFYLEEGVSIHRFTITPDPSTDNWYIDIPEEDQDLYVVLGRKSSSIDIDLAVSNVITTPRKHPSIDNTVIYIDVNQASSTSAPELIQINHEIRSSFLEEKVNRITKMELSSSK